MALSKERRERLEFRINKIRERLDAYYEAELEIASGSQQYSLGSRSLTRANLAEIRRAIEDLEKLLDRLTAELNGRPRNSVLAVVPIDY